MKNYITGIIWIIKDRSRLKKIYPDFTFDNWFKTLKTYHHFYTTQNYTLRKESRREFRDRRIIENLKKKF